MTNAVIERVEVITGVQRRRRWSVEEKLRIVEESYRPGASASDVARRHGLNANQLFTWRRLAREGVLGGSGDLLPVRLRADDGASERRETAAAGSGAGGIAEIAFPNGCRLRVGAGIASQALELLVRTLLAAR